MKKEWKKGGKRPQFEIRICKNTDCNKQVPDSRAYKLKEYCSKYCCQKEWLKHRYDDPKEISSP